MIKDAVLVASGDLRETANRLGWPAQEPSKPTSTPRSRGTASASRRGHPVDAGRGHGFISSQRMGMDVFAGIDRDAPVIVAEAVWQYSHHVLPGLRRHRGPILTVANWDGTWPGLVGMLNINASLTKMGRAYSTIWGEDLTDRLRRQAIAALDRDGRDRARREPRARPGSEPPAGVGGRHGPAARRRACRRDGHPRRVR